MVGLLGWVGAKNFSDHIGSPVWSRPLPRTLINPNVMTLRTLADARELVEVHLPAECRQRNTWRHVAKCLDDAARGGDIASALVALQVVLSLERVPCLPQ
jgi:hypothetical protein